MLRIGICEDESYLLNNMAAMVNNELVSRKLSGVVDTYDTGEGLLLSHKEYDIVLMDIGLAGMNGMEVARRLFAKDRHTAFVFITSYRDYALDAFEVQAVHFIVKPVSPLDITEAFERAMRRISYEDNGGLMVTRGNTRRMVLFRDIYSCEVLNHKLILQLEKEQVEFYGKLDALQTQLDNRFYRSHRSAIVNLNQIRSLEDDAVVLANGAKAPLARRKRQELATLLLDWLRREGKQ